MLRSWGERAAGGKVICYNSKEDHRRRRQFLKEKEVWSRGAKGLGDILDEGEGVSSSSSAMESLERFMHKYPAVWSESSVHNLLLDIGDNIGSEERLQAVIMRMLVPMARIMEVEQQSVMEERLKIQEATLALLRVQEECQHALADLTNEHERSTRDMEELGKALEENRKAAEEARRKLTEKERQIYLLRQQQQETLLRLVCGGPKLFLLWAREQINARGLTELHAELEKAWWPILAKPAPPECSKSTEPDPEPDLSLVLSTSIVDLPGTLLWIMASETIQQIMESCGRITGPFSLPAAVAGFWKGLAGRMSYLAMVTLFPEVMMQKRHKRL